MPWSATRGWPRDFGHVRRSYLATPENVRMMSDASSMATMLRHCVRSPLVAPLRISGGYFQSQAVQDSTVHLSSYTWRVKPWLKRREVEGLNG